MYCKPSPEQQTTEDGVTVASYEAWSNQNRLYTHTTTYGYTTHTRSLWCRSPGPWPGEDGAGPSASKGPNLNYRPWT